MHGLTIVSAPPRKTSTINVISIFCCRRPEYWAYLMIIRAAGLKVSGIRSKPKAWSDV
jgi:hypothetical protein